jgi:hypothetical protein
MTRLAGWQSALSAYLVQMAAAPFAYGQLDCGLFVAGAIEVMTGVDVVPGLRGTYGDREAAFAAVRALCGSPSMAHLADVLTARNGLRPAATLMAQRGDAVQIRSGRAARLGIVAMHGTEILTPYRAGILRLPLSHATRAWHV